jgi:O-antigen ligase
MRGGAGSDAAAIGRVHDRLALALAVLVPLTALPMASNRSVWWLVWTTLLAGLALLFLFRLAVLAPRHRLRIGAHRAAFALVLLLPLWAYVQSLPVADHVPAAMIRMAAGLADAAGPAISVQPDAAMAGILRFMGYMILIALVIEVASRRDRVLRVAQIVYAGVCLQAIWSLVALTMLGDVAPWGPKTAYPGSATGTFVNRNSLATFLGFGCVLGLGILSERARRAASRPSGRAPWFARLSPVDLLVIAGLCFLFLGLVATQSRLGLTASLAGCLATAGLMRWQAGASPLRVGIELSALALVAVGAVLMLSAGGGVADRFLFAGAEADDRGAIYAQTLRMIALRPWTGFGMDAFAAAFEAFRAPPLLAPVTYDLAHNSYLTLWVEFGVVFGTIPMVALALAGGALWRRMRSGDGFPGLAMAALGALVIAALHSLGDFSLEIPANVYLLMTVLGLGLGRLSRRSGQPGAQVRTGRGAA